MKSGTKASQPSAKPAGCGKKKAIHLAFLPDWRSDPRVRAIANSLARKAGRAVATKIQVDPALRDEGKVVFNQAPGYVRKSDNTPISYQTAKREGFRDSKYNEAKCIVALPPVLYV